jgi:hypothetical protein
MVLAHQLLPAGLLLGPDQSHYDLVQHHRFGGIQQTDLLRSHLSEQNKLKPGCPALCLSRCITGAIKAGQNAPDEWQVIIERERIARTNGWVALVGRLDPQGRTLPWAPFLEGKNKMGWYDKARLLFTFENSGISDNMIRKELSVQTQQQMALAAIAIERYRLKKGHLPSELSVLVPEYLSAVPRDSMDGKALRYRLAANGSFQLYSVGYDGKDNGGDPTLRPGTSRYPQIWDGRDAVWPAPATADGAEKSLLLEHKSQ